jgi:hypothetical protein
VERDFFVAAQPGSILVDRVLDFATIMAGEGGKDYWPGAERVEARSVPHMKARLTGKDQIEVAQFNCDVTDLVVVSQFVPSVDIAEGGHHPVMVA